MLGQILKESCEAAGVDRSFISQLERGLKSPTDMLLLRLCKVMKIKASVVIARVEK
jgi:transcriptional regulator with XRE-family HTH domain